MQRISEILWKKNKKEIQISKSLKHLNTELTVWNYTVTHEAEIIYFYLLSLKDYDCDC